MKRLFFFFAFLFLCGNIVAQDNYITVENIVYRIPGDDYVDSMCRLDLNYLEDGKDLPVVVWFHGGGLTGGKKAIPAELRGKGFVVVGVGYRFSLRVRVADCIDDAAVAVTWVYNNISKYGGSKSKIYLTGHSAGGYLVTMLGLDKSYLNRYRIDVDEMAAIIPYSGQAITHAAARQETGIGRMQPVVDELSPLYHVRKDAPPMLLLSGDRELEMIGRYEENAYFWRMLKLVGHPDVTLYEFDGFDHGTMQSPGHDIVVPWIRKREEIKN